MRYSAIMFASLLAVATVSINAAYADGRHHHHHHHHGWGHHHHHHHVPTADEMKAYAIGGVLSLWAGIPTAIVTTSAADHAAARVLRHQRRHGR